MRLHLAALLLPCLALARPPPAPPADHHQHLLAPAMAAPAQKPIDAKALIAMLDAAGIRRAVLLSNAFRYGDPDAPLPDEYARVAAENNWTASEAAKYPRRLVAFCSFNPLKDYALNELNRCARDPRFGRGIKLQLGSSDVNLDDPVEISLLRRVFRVANANGMAIVVHMRTRRANPYGMPQALVFLDELLAAAPDVPVQIAHLCGGGSTNDTAADQALGVFMAAIGRQDPRVKNLYFDTALVAPAGLAPERAQAVATQLRALGLKRIVYGSDGGDPTDPPPKAMLDAFRKLPLSAAEFSVIEGNVAPYLR
jgi:predicted TIM-barrel fold metal-dependent hydrolase